MSKSPLPASQPPYGIHVEHVRIECVYQKINTHACPQYMNLRFHRMKFLTIRGALPLSKNSVNPTEILHAGVFKGKATEDCGSRRCVTKLQRPRGLQGFQIFDQRHTIIVMNWRIFEGFYIELPIGFAYGFSVFRLNDWCYSYCVFVASVGVTF